MIRDISHLLIQQGTETGCSCRSGGALNDQCLPVEVNGGVDQTASTSEYFWNLFAFPFSLGSRRYALLTDRKTVLGLDESTFRDLIAARGAPVPAEVTDEQVVKWTELGLVSTKSAGQQFTKVFAAKSAAPRENELLHIITSYTCNLTCSYCFMLTDLAIGKKKILTFADARKGMDLYFGQPHKKDSVVHFYGGEPLLHPQFIDDCLGYIHARYSTEVLPKIITNGTLCGQRVMELLCRYHFDFSVSMDGDRKAHDVFRVDHSGRSTFDKTVRGIRRFQEIGYDPKVLITVGEHNIRRLPEVVEAVLDLGPHAIALNFPRELPTADNGLGDDVGESGFWVDQYERCLRMCYERNIPELYFADEPLPFHCDLRLRMAELLGMRLVSGKVLGFAAGATR
jgi:MoaA/NifB/PqqE/SkfB family radical SAM enzyme